MMTDDIAATRKQRGEQATAQQRRAADPARSVWVEASAGTGKTKVLSDRVLRLLLNGRLPAMTIYIKNCQNFWGACRRTIRTMPGWRLRHENFLPFCWILPAE